MSASRGSVDLVGHRVITVDDAFKEDLPPINNIILKAQKPEHQWIENATTEIGPWRAQLRSTYIRWALALNGLHVAAEKYQDPKWKAATSFRVGSLRPSRSGPNEFGGVNLVPTVIAQWTGDTTAEAHLQTAPMLCAFGVIDLYANLEEVIFSLYRIYLNQHPDDIIKGPDFQRLRSMRSAALVDPAKRPAWESAWNDRLNKWQEKKIYDGLGKVFRSLCSKSGIKAPKHYKLTNVDTWAESIETISLVRNSLVHGVSVVSDKLDIACQKPYAMNFKFRKGEPLKIELHHLQYIDCFCEQLLDALNISLIELAGLSTNAKNKR